MADIKIPSPTPEQGLSLSRAGVGNWNLVWDVSTRKWTIKKIKEIIPSDITYDDWKNGQKIYKTPEAPAGARLWESAVEDDPLAPFINKYKIDVVYDPQTNKTELKGFAADPKGNPTDATTNYYLYPDKNGVVTFSSDYESVKDAVVNNLKSNNTLDDLFKEFYNKKKITKQTFESKNLADPAFNSTLASAIASYSASVISNRKYYGVKEAPDFFNYLTKTGGDSGPQVEYRRTFQDISKLELGSFIDQIYLETIGQKPSKEQRSSKLKELDKIVKAGRLTTTTAYGNTVEERTTGGFDQQKEALALQEKIKTENPLEYERRQAFGFMDNLQKILSGGQ